MKCALIRSCLDDGRVIIYSMLGRNAAVGVCLMDDTDDTSGYGVALDLSVSTRCPTLYDLRNGGYGMNEPEQVCVSCSRQVIYSVRPCAFVYPSFVRKILGGLKFGSSASRTFPVPKWEVE